MKISFIAENDWANILTEYSHCINKHSKDIQSKSICYRPHGFKYSIQHDYDLEKGIEEQRLEAKKWVEDSDLIIFGEEGHPLEFTYRTLREFSNLLGMDIINSNKKLCIWHPGTHYRENFHFYNNHPQRHKIHKHLYAMDLYRLSPKLNNDTPLHTYQYCDFNYDKFILDFKTKLDIKPWVILHIPSNIDKKGTKHFRKVISQLNLDPKDIVYKELSKISNPIAMEEKKKSIFYLDQFNSAGSYGVAAVERLFNSNFTFSVVHNLLESIPKLTGDNFTPIVPLEYDVSKLKPTLETFILNVTQDQLLEYMRGIGKVLEKWYKPENIIQTFKNLLDE